MFLFHISQRVTEAKQRWDETQLKVDQVPRSSDNREAERRCAQTYGRLGSDEESFFKQKSRVQWLELVDRNTTFFHRSMVHRQARNMIHELSDEAGRTTGDQAEIGRMAKDYFKGILTAPSSSQSQSLPTSNLFPKKISEATTDQASRQFTDEEIRAALFSIPDNKSPGADGFTSYFFKKTWGITGRDFLSTIRYFLTNNFLPRYISATRIVSQRWRIRPPWLTSDPFLVALFCIKQYQSCWSVASKKLL